jgi:hypothetical protein
MGRELALSVAEWESLIGKMINVTSQMLSPTSGVERWALASGS